MNKFSIRSKLRDVLIGFLVGVVSMFIQDIWTFENPEIIRREIEQEVEKALLELDKSSEFANIITSVETNDPILSLSFIGLSDDNTNKTVMNLLNAHKANTPFFVSGNTAAENSEFVKKLRKNKYSIESNTLHGKKHLEDLSNVELVNDLVRANFVIKNLTNIHPTYLIANSTNYTDEFLRVAYVANNKNVVKPSHFLNYQSFKSYDEVLNYFKKIDKGAIVVVKMDGILEEDEFESPIKDEKPAEDKRPNTDDTQIETALTPQERLINMVEWILKAIKEIDYELVSFEDLSQYEFKHTIEVPLIEIENPVSNNGSNSLEPESNSNDYFETLRKENNGHKAQEIKTIHTTEKALTYTFYGIENGDVLEAVLDNLDVLSAKGTFFISQKNLINNTQEIETIHKRGHELGIALSEEVHYDFYSTIESILNMQEALYNMTSQEVKLVRYPYYVEINDDVLEAISSADALVVWDNLSMASSRFGPDGKEDDILVGSFGPGNMFVQRGYNIYYRMDYYNDHSVIPNLLLSIHQKKISPIAYSDANENNNSAYKIKSVGSLLASDEIYRYPVPYDSILSFNRNKIYPNHLAGLSDEQRFAIILNKYVGNPHTASESTLPGFNPLEITQIDTSGRFTNDKVLFLTFDDWSSDKPINQILYVLDKHDVKANFYIRTNYMLNNPNLLRAIAQEGHDVGNHSDNHMPLAGLDTASEGAYQYLSLSEKEVEVVKDDFLRAHNKLLSVVGDVQINGRAALTNIVRPPTLAISRSGLEGVLDLGFDYVLSGDFSSHDYEIYDPDVLADRLVNGFTTGGASEVLVENGTVYILHMYDFVEKSYDSLNVTAQALDIAIPILKSKGYQFARVSDYLK